MIRALLTAIAASVSLTVAIAITRAQDPAPKPGAQAPNAPSPKAAGAAATAAPGAAAGAGGAAAPAASPSNFANTVSDSGIVTLTFTDVNTGTTSYEIRRSVKGSSTDPSSFLLSKGTFSLVDMTARNTAGATFVYTLYSVDSQGRPSIASIASTSAVIPAATALATPLLSNTSQFGDRTQWLPAPQGNWLPEAGDSYSQADDSQVGALIFQEKSSWIGSPVTPGKVQISAAITLQGWDSVTALANTGLAFPTPPSFRFGLGFATTDPTNRAAIFLVVNGDIATAGGGLIEDDKGSKLAAVNIDKAAWTPGSKIRLKFRIERAANAAQAAVKGKFWKDGQPEPGDDSYSRPVSWTWPTGTVVPALFGGIQVLGKQAVKATFSEVLLETFPAAAPAVAPPGPSAYVPPSILVPPAMTDKIWVPRQAITYSQTGRLGTLIGQISPDAPVSVACAPPPCLWPVRTASTIPCCASATFFAGSPAGWITGSDGVPISGVPVGTFGADGIYGPGVPIETIPRGATFPTFDPIDFKPGFEALPTIENGEPQISAPTLGRTPSNDTKVRNTSAWLDDQAAAPVVGPAAIEPAPASSVSSNEKAKAPSLPLQLSDPVQTSVGALRDFGAVATLPDAPKNPKPLLSQAQRECADAVILETMKQSSVSVDVKGLLTRMQNAQGNDPNDLPPAKLTKGLNDDLLDLINKGITIATMNNDWSKDVQYVVGARIKEYTKGDIPTKLTEVYRTKLAQALAQPRPPGSDQALIAKIQSHAEADATNAYLRRPSRSEYPADQADWPTSSPTSGNSRGRGGRVARDPFSFQPTVQIVPISYSSTDYDANSALSARDDSPIFGPDELKNTADARVWTYHFDHPARFPRNKFGANCCAFEGEGAVIHEGMRLLASQDGRYEVRFNISAPSIPVALRLQLILYQQGKPDPSSGSPIPRTLTLPLIVIEPTGPEAFPQQLEAGIHPVSYLVSVQGYSQVIKEAHDDENGTGHLVLVKRNGTARIGSGVQYQATP